jgi:uncharacterized protein (TIGR02265 family)
MAHEAGQTLDRYTLEALVGEGGMGRVYRAFDARLQRHVALKVLRATASDPEHAVADVLREARAAAALAHPNATAVFDAGVFEGRAFIVMEYVPGTSLRRLVGATEVPMATRLRWLVDIAGALAAAHQVGVIHRDIKPENVMVREDGLVKVLDFGVAGRARLLDPEAGSGAVGMVAPSRGNTVGTPAYMAPEQLRGVAIDGRADQFAWAVLAYELLTGRLPWKGVGDFMRYLVAVLTEEVDPPSRFEPAIPAPVEAAILRSLAKSPDDRFPTMVAVAAALAPHAGAALQPSFALPEAPEASRPRSEPPPSSRLRSSPSGDAVPPSSTPLPPSSPMLVLAPAWSRSIGSELAPIVDAAARTTFAARVPTPRAGPSALALALRPPRFGVAVDLDEHVRRVPSGATVKGMFFLELQRVAEEASVWPQVRSAAGVGERRYFAFGDYPMVDNLRLTVAVAAHVHPRLTQGEAIRRLGQAALDVVLGSQIGRALFGVLGRNVESLFLRGPRAFKLLLGVGDVTSEKISNRTFRFQAKHFPAFLETYQVGVIEGVLRHCGEKGRILIALEDVANAVIEVEIL